MIDLLVILICLAVMSLLLILLYGKQNGDEKQSSLRKTLILSVGFIALCLFVAFLFYLVANTLRSLYGISFSAFFSGFLVGIILLPRFVVSRDYNPKRAIQGGVISGAIIMFCYNLLWSIGEYISNIYIDISKGIMGIWIDLDFFSSIFAEFVWGYSTTPFQLFNFVTLPLWGFIGWLAHRWFQSRQHHYAPQT